MQRMIRHNLDAAGKLKQKKKKEIGENAPGAEKNLTGKLKSNNVIIV